MSVRPGEPIRDRYVPVRVVGHGGQGELILARDLRHDRIVAVKVRRIVDAAALEAAIAEAGVLLALPPHPGVAVVREDFTIDDRVYLVMDLVEGPSLQALLDAHGAMTAEAARPLITQIAAALDHLHAQRPPVVHRDVKPANVIVRADGSAVLVDFGLSVRGDAPGAREASAGFSAPEISWGERAGTAADVYGLAATAYAMLAGAPPGADGAGPIDARAHDVVRRSLSTDPAKRHPSAGALARDLAGDPAVAGRGRFLRLIAAVVGLTMAVGGSAFVALRDPGEVAGGPVTVEPGSGSTGTSARPAASASASASASDPATSPPSPTDDPTRPARTGAPILPLPASGAYPLELFVEEELGGATRTYAQIEGEVTVRAGQTARTLVFAVATDADHIYSEDLTVTYTADGMRWTHDSVVECETAQDPLRLEGWQCSRNVSDYDPPAVRVPWPLAVGYRWSGSTRATRENGSTRRTESFDGSVLRTETVALAGERVTATVVRWRSTFAGDEPGSRDISIWVNPRTGMWLRWEETFRLTRAENPYRRTLRYALQ